MRAEQAAGVLRAGVALDVGLEQVAERRGDRDADAEQERLGPDSQSWYRPADHVAKTAVAIPMSSPSTVLFGDRSAQLVAAEPAPADVGAAVADEGPDEDADEDPAAVRQLAQQHPVGERRPIQATPKIVMAMPRVPRGVAERGEEDTGKTAMNASSTWKSSPTYAARSTPVRPRKPARRTGSTSA